MSETERALDIGSVIAGRLELVSILGEGASGRVYRAHHRLLDKSVAVKVLHPTGRPEMAARFKAEARAASRIDQVNTVRIFDFGEENHMLYLTMELLEGETLYSRLRRAGRPDAQASIELTLQILAALAAAHREGIVHRDLKPGNIILVREIDDDGAEFERVKVCDFGLAKLLDADPAESLTGANAIVGTPGYMAPEQASGGAVDARTDIYACGAVLFELLAGQPPFVGDSITEVLVQVIIEEAPSILSVAPYVEPALAAIVMRALSKKKEQRFESAAEMMGALRAMLEPSRLARAWIPRLPSTLPRAVSPVFSPMRAVSSPTPSSLAAPAPIAEPGLHPAPLTLSGLLAEATPSTAAGDKSDEPGRAVSSAPAAPPRSPRWTLAALMTLSVALGGIGALFVSRLFGSNARPIAETQPIAAAVIAPAPDPAPPVREAIAPVEAVAAVEEKTIEPLPVAEQAKLLRAAAVTKKPATSTPAIEAAAIAQTPAEVEPVLGAPQTAAGSKSDEPGRSSRPVAREADAARVEPVAVAPIEVATEERTRPSAEPQPAIVEPVSEREPASASDREPAAPAERALMLSIGEVEVSGGLAAKRCASALSRAIPALRACFNERHTIAVRAKIGGDGRLRQLRIDDDAKAPCIEEALAAARMPRPDTGDASMSFRVSLN